MPFQSEAQRRMLWATNPKVAQEFADKTPKGKKLPMHVKRHAMLEHLKGHESKEGK